MAAGGSEGGTAGTGCLLCGRATYDPARGEGAWARGVAGARQVLICPECQRTRPTWDEGLDRCGTCSSTRLSLVLGDVVCRACGATTPAASQPEAWPAASPQQAGPVPPAPRRDAQPYRETYD